MRRKIFLTHGAHIVTHNAATSKHKLLLANVKNLAKAAAC